MFVDILISIVNYPLTISENVLNS